MKLKIIISFSKITSIIIILNGWNPWGCVRFMKQSLKIIISKIWMPFNVTCASRKITDTLQSKKKKRRKRRMDERTKKKEKKQTNNNMRKDQQPAQRNQKSHTKITTTTTYLLCKLTKLGFGCNNSFNKSFASCGK